MWSQTIFNWLQYLGDASYWIVFLVSCAESVAFIGLLVPSTTIFVATGLLVGLHVLRFEPLILAVVLGGILGDVLSFYLGSKGGNWFKDSNKIFKLQYLKKGEVFFVRHGAKSVFLARFFAPLRSVVPFVAGLVKMSLRVFIIYNVAGAVLSAFVYVGGGYLIGKVSERYHRFFSRGEGALIVLVIALVGGVIFRRFLLQKGREIVMSIKSLASVIIDHIFRLPVAQRLLAHHRLLARFLALPERRTGLLMVLGGGVGLVVFGILMVTGVVNALLGSPSAQFVDTRLLSFAYDIRSPALSTFAAAITSLGAVVTIVVGGSIVLGCCLYRRRYAQAVGYAISLVGSSVTMVIMKEIVGRARPGDFLALWHETSLSFPSGHATLAVASYVYVAHLLIGHRPTWARKVNMFFGAVLLIVLIGASRVYGGVHYPSDIVGGYVLGALWLVTGVGVEKILQGAGQE